MDLGRYLDLYLAESEDHLRLLNQGLLALEAGEHIEAAVEESFRAAHTIKGMSATMGFRTVTDICHQLEDRLDDVRAKRLRASREVVDELLARADDLERAVKAAATGSPQVQHAEPAAGAPRLTTAGAPTVPTAGTPRITTTGSGGGRRVVRVKISDDSPMRAARALLLVRGLSAKQLITGSEPSDFTEAFGGTVVLFPVEDVDFKLLEGEIARAADIASVSIEDERSAPAEVEPAAAPVERRASAARLVRVDQQKLDSVADDVAELSVLHARLEHALHTGAGVHALEQMVDRIGVLAADLQTAVLSMRMVPVGDVFDRLPRLVRDAARALGKDVEFHLEGRDIELDRAILDEVIDPLIHLLRNAVDHGIEGPIGRIAADKSPRGQLTLRAIRERNSVRIEVEDDGRGVNAAKVIAKAEQLGVRVSGDASDVTDEELLRILSHPGFSTAEQVTDVSGRGVGMDAVVNRVRALGGALSMRSRPGEGSTFSIRLPITLALAQALHVRVAGEDYAIPLTHVTEALVLDPFLLLPRNGREGVLLREEVLPLVRLREVLRSGGAGQEGAAVITEVGEARSALAVDELVGREQILVKQFDPAIGTLPFFSGVTLLADGRPALVLDPLSVV